MLFARKLPDHTWWRFTAQMISNVQVFHNANVQRSSIGENMFNGIKLFNLKWMALSKLTKLHKHWFEQFKNFRQVSQVSKVISDLFSVTYCQTVGHHQQSWRYRCFLIFIHIMIRKFNVKQFHQVQSLNISLWVDDISYT